MNEIVDLRSDTVTRPTPEMLAAMTTAPLGDDVLGDDPTVLELERLSAQMLGHESALFVPSGTMGNQIAVATHTQPGDVMIIEEEAHVFYYEVGAPAILNGVMTRTLRSQNGVMDPDDVERAILKRNLHTPGTSVVAVENTHNRAGGTIVHNEHILAYRTICDRHGVALHLDGARVFNAAVAQGIPVSEITKHFDSVSFCLSKGLRSPVGSVLVGSRSFIDGARIWRKRLGGGMRQAGVLAACGIVSLTNEVDRLADDHLRTFRLAEALLKIPGITIDMGTVQTNILLVQLDQPVEPILERLHNQGVWALSPGSNRIRFVFHADINDEMCSRTISVLKEILTSN